MADGRISAARQQMRDAVAAIDKAAAEAIAAFEIYEPEVGHQDSFEAIDEVVRILESRLKELARLQEQARRRIWASEEMSLATLASRIGVSKARAQQLADRFKAERDKPEEGQ
jgi:hypothetical protein